GPTRVTGLFLNVTEAIKNSSFFYFMYKPNNICFTGILQLIELRKLKVPRSFNSKLSKPFDDLVIYQQKENSADAESQLEI
ncbi:hypothetical protein ACFWDG_25125, partial [Peribacillus sp. NPDC060186]